MLMNRPPGSFRRMQTTLTVVRHGETDWNRDRRIQGQTDITLNEAGIRQADELRDALEGVPFDAVYASDLERAWRTAAVVADPRGLVVQRRPGLREKDFGTWEGLTGDERVHVGGFELFSPVAEELHHRPVRELYRPGGVEHQHRIGEGVEQRLHRALPDDFG